MAGTKKPMYWISGNRRDCRKAFQELCQKIGDPNVQAMISGRTPEGCPHQLVSGGDVILTLKARDMFDTRPRILKVVGVPPGYIEIADYLGYVNKNNILVFYGPTTYRKPGTKQNISIKTSNLYKKIKEFGTVLEYPTEGKPKEAIQRAIDVAIEHGKQIESDAVDRLVTLKGYDFDLIESEVIKLCDYQQGKKITVDDVNACCSPTFLDDIWLYLELLDKQDVENALAFLQKAYRAAHQLAPSRFYGEFMGLLYNLTSHYRFLLVVKDLCGEYPAYKPVADHLATLRKINPTDAKELARLSAEKDGEPENAEKQQAYVSYIEGLSPAFSPQMVSINFKNSEVLSLLRKQRKYFYDVWLDLKRCELLMRQHSNDATMIELCLNTFTMVACEKMTPEESALVRGPIRR